jgi:hypothetical protein
VNGSALFSTCRTWRYALTRELADGAGTVAFVGLNPSTADDASDDPTIRRCIGFARDWGFARLEVVNVYALCASSPRDLWRADDPVGPENDRVLAQVLDGAELVIAAWGRHARADRLAQLAAVFDGRRLHALGVTKTGAPRHALYLRSDARPSPYAASKKPLSAASFDAGPAQMADPRVQDRCPCPGSNRKGGVPLPGTMTTSLVHQYASMTPSEFGKNIEPKWQVGGQLVDSVRAAVEKKQLTPLDGARLISSIAATLFGYDEFILREISPETLLAAGSPRR